MKRNVFFCLVLAACSSHAVTLEELPFETVVETAGEATPKLVSYGKAQAMVANESAYPVATNALALAEGALQPPATNGLQVAVAHAQSAHGVMNNGGFAGGNGASATYGGAVGADASATTGGAVGTTASATTGGAVGTTASATTGGAVGDTAVTSSGFAGGYRAMAALDNTGNGTPIDAIQLGTGWNPDANTLQIYDHKLLNADGSIPAERMATTLSGYATTGAVAAEIEAATSPKMTMVPTGTTVISTDTTVQVVPTRGIYNLHVQGDSDISFDLSSIDITNNVARWETWIKVFAPGMTVGLPSTNAVQYLETPDLTTTTANELMQISWQAWMDGTNLMMQGSLYNRNTQMPPPTLAEMRTYHYGSPDIVGSPAWWFDFGPGTGTITIFSCEEGRENVVIPWEIGGVAVEAIGEWAFSPYNSGLPVETVIGPKTVLSIGNEAFAYCSLLTSVSLPAATSIGSTAFGGCSSLTSVSLPAATSIGNEAFYSCRYLTSISLPAATSVGDYAFGSCSFLTSVYFGTDKPTEGIDMFYSGGDPINVTIYYPSGASEWSGVDTWGGMPTAPYTPPAP